MPSFTIKALSAVCLSKAALAAQLPHPLLNLKEQEDNKES